MLASLGGLDALVFTAGIGGYSARVREQACAPFAFLDLQLDSEHNQAVDADQSIAGSDSAVDVLVVRTREEWAIARECWALQQSSVA